ncbi:MAG: hypothetical protein JOZ69_23325, partial [Myxococcales bacterium]|nr:hypothetical protein [Myxococcales bacterium]
MTSAAVYALHASRVRPGPRAADAGGLLARVRQVIGSLSRRDVRAGRRNRAHATPVAETTVEEARALVATAVRDGGRAGALVVVDVPPGSGKSHVARELLPPGENWEEVPSVMLTPTAALALQHFHRTGGQLHLGVLHEVRDQRGELLRDVCKKPKEVESAYKLGLSAAPVCARCEHARSCSARDVVGDRARGVLSVHDSVGKFDDLPPIVDEWPNSTLETFEIPANGLVDIVERRVDARPPRRRAQTIEAYALAELAWTAARDALLAWAAAVEAGQVGDSDVRSAAANSRAPAVGWESLETISPAEGAPEGVGPAEGSPLAGFFRWDWALKGVALQQYKADVATVVALWKAARPDARFERTAKGGWLVTRLAGVLYALQTRGGSLLASGAPAAVLVALRGQCAAGRADLYGQPRTEIRRVPNVADGRSITRVMVSTTDATTRKLKRDRGSTLLGRVFADIQRRAEAFGAKPEEIAVFVAKAFEPAARMAIPGA